MYMQSLPRDKIPLRGFDGEKYRVKQYSQQLPAYDHSLDACHKMAEFDKKRMSKFIDRTKRKFFGVGIVGAMAEDEEMVIDIL